MTEAPSVIEAWKTFYTHTHLRAPVTEADYLEIKALADYLFAHHNVDKEPYASLLDILEDYMHDWELINEPELKDIEVEPRLVLAHLMEQQGVTQYALAKEGVVNQGTLSRILKGERGISKALAKRLSERFSVSVETFL